MAQTSSFDLLFDFSHLIAWVYILIATRAVDVYLLQMIHKLPNEQYINRKYLVETSPMPWHLFRPQLDQGKAYLPDR